MHRVMGFLLVAGLLLLSGCYDRIEVNDLAIVTLAGIDAHEDGIRLTVRMVVPAQAQMAESSGQAGPRTSVVFTATGTTVLDAMKQIQLQVSRRLFWGHTRALVIGEEYARQGIRPALDFWSRHHQPRPLLLVGITPGDALDFLSEDPRLERLMSEAIRETLNLKLQTRVTIREFLRCLADPGKAAVAPRILSLPGIGGGKDVKISGTAIFDDDRLVGYLDVLETRGLLWLRDEIAGGVVTVLMEDGNRVSLEIIWGRTQVRPLFRGGQLRMTVHADADLDLSETSAPLDLEDSETLEHLKALVDEAIANRIREVLEIIQSDFGVDALRFGDAVRRGAPIAWEGGLKDRWPELFPDVPVELSTTTRIRRVGEHSRPLGFPDRQIRSRTQ